MGLAVLHGLHGDWLRWDEQSGSLNLKAAFGGYEKMRCYAGMEQERCVAQRIRGVIRFHGNW